MLSHLRASISFKILYKEQFGLGLANKIEVIDGI